MSDIPVNTLSVDDAAGIWAACKKRLEEARTNFRHVSAIVAEANAAEEEAWTVLQRLAGRDPDSKLHDVKTTLGNP